MTGDNDTTLINGNIAAGNGTTLTNGSTMDKDRTTLTRLAARRLKEIAEGRFSAKVRNQAQVCLIDSLGAMQAGLAHELAPCIQAYTASNNNGCTQARAFAIGGDTDAETAAFSNSVLSHVIVRDDMHLGSVAHIGSMVVPAALALSQKENWTGDQLIRALVGGYEMGALLGTALRETGRVNQHLRASGLVGAFAAAGAAVCGHAVDEDTIVNALALAVNCACGFNAWAWCPGANELVFHNGTAARAGLTSFSLALAGVPASDAVLEGRDGFFDAVGVGASATDTFTKWIEGSQIGRGILESRFKPTAGCNYTQTSTALALRLAKKMRIYAAEINSIVVTTTSAAIKWPGCDNTSPRQRQQAKMSIQYGVCVALVLGDLDEKAWSPVDHPEITALAHRCQLVASPAYDKRYRAGFQPARVVVTLKSGEELAEEADDVPWLDDCSVIDRSRNEMSTNLPADVVDAILARCQNLDHMKQCRNLFEAQPS